MNSTTDLQREELEGCLQLGMEREALNLTRRILARKRVGLKAFRSAVDALLIFADGLHYWRHRVVRAFDQLNNREKAKASPQMFHFYVSLNLWEDAGHFLPKKPASAHELLFSMWTLLQLDRVTEAGNLRMACCRLLNKAGPDFEQSCMIEAMGAYLMKTRDLDLGEKYWWLGTDLWPFAPQAWERLAKLHAMRGLEVAHCAFEFMRSEEDVNEAIGISPEDVDVLRQAFRRHAKSFARVVDGRKGW